jgi:hypothetical protein
MLNREKLNTNIVLYLVATLFLFLPFSSWLVSLTGNIWTSAVRDILVVLIFIFATLNIKRFKPNFSAWTVIVFLIYALLSFFWREASAAQWLKGARFLLEPLVLFISLSTFQFDVKQKKILFITLFTSAAIIIIFAILEIFHIYIPLTTALSGSGGITRGSMVGTINIERLQSVLDGPNALGLFLLALSGYVVAFFRNKTAKYILLILSSILLLLTFSRSALLGLIVLTLIYLGYTLKKAKISKIWICTIPIAIALIISFAGFSLYKNPSTRDFISHQDSTSERFLQYQRVWDSRYEIGLLGRGTGTAGPSSQNRIDGGPNHFTENIYLDIYEELGLVGIAIYLVLIVSLIVYSGRRVGSREGLGAFLLLISFSSSGFFVNYYTGQVGIFLVWLMAGLLIQNNNRLKKATLRAEL